MKLYGWLGILLLLVSEYCLFRKIEPFVTWFYCFAWWAYILIADNLLLKLSGNSLLTGSRRELWRLIPLSIFIWLLFEAYNFSIKNWEYNRVPLQLWQRWLGYGAAFSTVLPGIFITSELVGVLLFRTSAPTEWPIQATGHEGGSGRSCLLVGLGVAMSAAPLVWPHYCFPAVWLGPIFMLDPLLEKVGARSLSSDIRSGNRQRIWSLLLGGLLCGFLWEFWNFWAGSKWLYHVPYFGKWKFFEMPVLGFLGFPPFALECWILYHLLRALPRKLKSLPAQAGWWVLIGILSVIIFHEIDKRSILHFAETCFPSLPHRSNS